MKPRVRSPEPGSSVKAVSVGLVVDVAGSIVVGAVPLLIYGFMHAAEPTNRESVDAALSAPVSVISWTGAATVGVDWMFSVLGGYLCASRRPWLRC